MATATPTRTMREEDATTGELVYGEIVVIDKMGEQGDRLPFYGRALIGRTEDCDIRINLPYVSRKHALICIDENGNVSMRNLAKRNMTMVNNVGVDDEVVLASGDVVTIADRRFEWVGSDAFLRSSKDVVSVKPKQRGNGAKNKSKTPKTPKAAPPPVPSENRSALKEKSNSVLNRADSSSDEVAREKALEASRVVDDIFGVLKATPRPQKGGQSAKKKNDKSASKPRALPTPLRKGIQQHRGEQTPAKDSQTDADKSNKSRAGEDQENRTAAASETGNSAVSSEEEGPAPSVFADNKKNATKKSALATPVREEIRQRGNKTQGDIFAKKKSALATPVREEIRQRGNKTQGDTFAKKKSALATPVREEIRQRGNKTQGDIFAKKKSALATPVREEIRHRGNKTETDVFAKKKSALATPVREEIRQRNTKAQADVFAKKKSALATPVREEIRAQMPRAEKQELKKVLATPLRKQIESEERFAGLPASAARFLKRTPGDAVADAIRAAADADSDSEASESGTEHEQSEHETYAAADNVEADGEELLETGGDAADDERAAINAQLVARGYEVSRYEGWSIDELTQRLRSATLQDDLVSAYNETDNEEYDGDYADEDDEEDLEDGEASACETPKKPVVFQGKHKVFNTPGDTPKSTVSGAVAHWTYSDYERDDDEVSDGASTVSLNHVAQEQDEMSAASEDEAEEEDEGEVVIVDSESVEENGADVKDDTQEKDEALADVDDVVAQLSNQLEAAVTIEDEEEGNASLTASEHDEAEDAEEIMETASPLPSPENENTVSLDQDQESVEDVTETNERANEESMAQDQAESLAAELEKITVQDQQGDEEVVAVEESEEEADEEADEEISPVPARRKSMRLAKTEEVKVDESESEDDQEEEEEEETAPAPVPARRKSLRLAKAEDEAAAKDDEEEDDDDEEDDDVSEDSKVLDQALVAKCEAFKVTELREFLKQADLETKGKKAELVERLALHIENLPAEARDQFFSDSASETGETAEDDDTPRRTILIPSMLKVAELKDELASRGLEAKGRKAELAAQLQEAIIEDERKHVEKSDDGEVFIKENHEMLWRPVARELSGELCPAVVVGFLPPTDEDPYEMFRIRFLDGDVEDLEPEELAAACEAFAEL